jgi:hypothetical protein
MCIMEVREGQHHSTIAQAEAHNVGTVVGDLDMFRRVLETRGQPAKAQRVDEISSTLVAAYEDLMDLYCGFLTDEVHNFGPDHLNLPDGATFDNVADLVREIVQRDAKHAHVYETR